MRIIFSSEQNESTHRHLYTHTTSILLSIPTMKVPLCLILLTNFATQASAFRLVSPSALAKGKIVSKYSLPKSLKSHNDDASESENDFDGKYKNMRMNDIRKSRLEKESMNFKRFASGEELAHLREDLDSLRKNLEWAKALKDEMRVESLEKAIKKGESRDPSYMYNKARNMIAETKKMEDASDEEKKIVIEKWTNVASDAREFLPQLNMEGLWVGDYGDSKGLQLINVTYSGDELIATKVTGDTNVPRGKISFTANVQPSNTVVLPRVEEMVSDHRSGELLRFPGKGQVSRKGFKNNRFIEGQMMLLDDCFSFVWISTKHHVSFHRPSPETTLKLLRNTISKEDELERQRDHLSLCFDMDLSTAIARHQDPLTKNEPLRRITTQEELEQIEERLKQGDRGNILLQIGKWRNYIDKVMEKKST